MCSPNFLRNWPLCENTDNFNSEKPLAAFKSFEKWFFLNWGYQYFHREVEFNLTTAVMITLYGQFLFNEKCKRLVLLNDATKYAYIYMHMLHKFLNSEILKYIARVSQTNNFQELISTNSSAV